MAYETLLAETDLVLNSRAPRHPSLRRATLEGYAGTVPKREQEHRF